MNLMKETATVNPFIGLAYGPSMALVAQQHSDRLALVWGGRRFSFSEVKREVDRASVAISRLGLVKGDKLAIWLPNRPEFIWNWLGAAQIGVIPVVLNTRLTTEEVAYQLEQSDSRAVVIPGDGAFRDFLGDLISICPEIQQGRLDAGCATRLPKLEYVLALDAVADPPAGIDDWSSPRVEESPLPPFETDPHAPGMIAYSSGTTALPKGVVLNQSAFRKAWDHGERFEQTPEDRLLLAVPLFGILANLNGILTFWSRGSAVVLESRFEPGRALDLIESERCTAAYFLPSMVDRMLDHPEFRPERVTSIRTGVIATTDPALTRQAVEALGMDDFITTYGMTETSSVCMRTHCRDPLDVRLETHGTPLPDIEIRIGDIETGQEVPPGTEGEIQVRGYNLLLGYYRKPTETAAAMTPDGFFRTGDLGVQRTDGRFKFMRRIRDGYKHKGFNVSTAEVEAAIAEHPNIASAAVLGIPDGANGEIGVAFVISRDGRTIEQQELLETLRTRLASFKLPAHIFTVAEFARTSGTDRVQKFRLRELALEKIAADTSP